jgi:hypothetical protein
MLFSNSAPCLNPEAHYSSDELFIAISGFQGEVPIIFPYKKNEVRAFSHRGQWNSDRRKQMIVNEWGIEAESSRWRIFLCRWAYDDNMFPIEYKTIALLISRIGSGRVDSWHLWRSA